MEGTFYHYELPPTIFYYHTWIDLSILFKMIKVLFIAKIKALTPEYDNPVSQPIDLK